jgi:hypothetical protein
MLRALLKVLLVVIVVVAAGAFFMGYRWGDRGIAPEREPAVGTTGTTDSRPVDTSKARETGAEIGEKVAVGADKAEHAMTNASLTAKIKSKMALDDHVSASSIDVDSEEGVVTLSGRVKSESEKQRALQLARETEGVKRVINRLTVQ